MTLSIIRGFFLPLLLLVCLPSPTHAVSPVIGASAQVKKAECPVCGMHFKETAKTSFYGTHDGKPMHLCSFSCAAKLSDRSPQAELKAVDFGNGKQIPADKAYFLIRSKKVLPELDFDMPPSVVAFAEAKAAEEKKKSLGDGQVVHGWAPLKKELAP